MKHVKVLDCTLRDGGYVVDSIFGDKTIKGIIDKLCRARIDLVEVGFLKNTDRKEGSSTFRTVEQMKEFLPQYPHEETKLVAMIDFGRYDVANLNQNDGSSIDMIRNCFFKKDREEAVKFTEVLKDKGYEVFVQPVDILGYTDKELLKLIEETNEMRPYAFSIVDTFGSMYQDDLLRIFNLVHHNLDKSIRLGFHSHNNMQMSFALAQEFIKMSRDKREVIVDATLCGMGRGAGNTNTELIVDYLNRKCSYGYDMNELLEVIDNNIVSLMKSFEWGYSIPYMIAGMHSSHVHNISYLLDKHNITSKDMRVIIGEIEENKRKSYDYDNLEQIYISYFDKHIDDNDTIEELKRMVKGRCVMILAPGKSVELQRDRIDAYLAEENPIMISVNHINDNLKTDLCFFSSTKRYEQSAEGNAQIFDETEKILTSNIKTNPTSNEMVVNYNFLVKQGWKYFDNSAILLLRLLDKLGVRKIGIAGLDGFEWNNNYADEYAELDAFRENKIVEELNENIQDMLGDIRKSAKQVEFKFITESRFADIFNK